MFEFSTPHVWFLTLWGLLPVLGWLMWRRSKGGAVRFSDVRTLWRLRSSWRVRFRWFPAALRLTALALLIFLLARPREGERHNQVISEGIAMQLVIDRSGSMEGRDFKIDGQREMRLDVVKKVASEFVTGDEEQGLDGRPSDMIGVIAFGSYPDHLAPMTLDHQHIVEVLSSINLPEADNERGTAIGDALGLAVERLVALESRRLEAGNEPLKSKVVVLLTDGKDRMSEIPPDKAAELAKAANVRVYTIGVGSDQSVPAYVVGPTGDRSQSFQRYDFDAETLKSIAEITGGEYYHVRNTEALREVYQRIDELEKSELDEKRYMTYKELAVDAAEWGMFSFPPLLVFPFVLLGIEILLRVSVFRKLN